MKNVRPISRFAKLGISLCWSCLMLVGCQPASQPSPGSSPNDSSKATTTPAPNSNSARDGVRPEASASSGPSGSLAQEGPSSDNPIGAAGESTDTGSIDPVRRLVAAEELILELTPALDPLQQDLLNLSLPTERNRDLFAPQAVLVDLSLANQASTTASTTDTAGTPELLTGSKTATFSWTSLESSPTTAYWKELFQRIAYWEHAKLSIVKGQFTDADLRQFQSQISLGGLARSKDGKWLDVRGHLDVTWARTESAMDHAPTTVGPEWKIIRWQPVTFTLTSASDLQFRDVLAQAIPDQSQRRSLLESQNWLYAIHHYYPKRAARADSKIDDARFFPISTAYHPGLSVVDLDRDGWDDLYVVDRWGANQLLMNQRNGTFRNDSQRYGLDIDGRSNASVFADFDNDGDADLMLARGMERSLYLVNENGHFVDRSTDLVNHPLPMEATSVSAADYNGDGLLDVYFSTYHQDDISRRIDADLAHPDHRIHRTLTPEHSEELKQRFRNEAHSFINQVGPPNILLVNRGQGRFELAPENPDVALWRNSFQATWCDFDQDGDPDLYVANDFAADHLLRNDGPQGFHDVTQEMGIDQLGFAMGASWGDYDNDGQQDLYVSNMYSKAGRRITQGVDQLDPRIAQLANGNYLYDYDGQRFQLVSGVEPPKLTVARAGWAWGGQFFDANNDGFLDLYVASGYYTVPAPYETKVDL